MTEALLSARRRVAAIRASSLTIYDPITVGDPDLWLPAGELEVLLDHDLRGISLAGLPLRTRSKVVNEHLCRALGYPVPPKFSRTQPRFPGQMFDKYVQKADNLQVWNEELAPTRRYVLIRVSDTAEVVRVKVVTGDALARLDTTGTLTKKYQARWVAGESPTELVTPHDTGTLASVLRASARLQPSASPVDPPDPGQLFSIAELFARLAPLVGVQFADAGHDQERNRGAALHRLVCERLGYSNYRDDGRFPDVRHQLLEVKLQTAPTVDLGLVRPDSSEPLDLSMVDRCQVRHCDVRYAVFGANLAAGHVTVTHLILSTGEGFFLRFPQFQGNVLNAKLQIPLPRGFFET